LGLSLLLVTPTLELDLSRLSLGGGLRLSFWLRLIRNPLDRLRAACLVLDEELRTLFGRGFFPAHPSALALEVWFGPLQGTNTRTESA
jgi:hypothetical protein